MCRYKMSQLKTTGMAQDHSEMKYFISSKCENHLAQSLLKAYWQHKNHCGQWPVTQTVNNIRTTSRVCLFTSHINLMLQAILTLWSVTSHNNHKEVYTHAPRLSLHDVASTIAHSHCLTFTAPNEAHTQGIWLWKKRPVLLLTA